MSSESDLAKRSHDLFTRAMELDASVRRAFILNECAGDEPLAHRLNRLLDAAERADSFLESPLIAPRMEEPDAIPDAVGDYLVVGVLGAGGMATVYEAIQEQPRRRVALKVLHQSMTHTDAYRRFLFETETLARLHHPGIAQIYEVGATRLGHPESAPFFAMELIPDAVPITKYADQRALTVTQRVRMLASVCDAVHHGHQHGVIHRDIKPGNVLVDSEGHAKVIDFGVARAADANAASLTAISDAGQLIGTLNSMSPEQCAPGGEIDTRTDVYSLGVLLYELCCGRLPHDLSGLPLPAALTTIMSAPPHPPSIPRIAGHRDLEAIMLKAIEKDPDARYDSAGSLAADLRRWLNAQPIEARPPGVREQAMFFARRNRALVAGGITLAASVILIAVISTAFVVRLTDEVDQRRIAERRAETERDQARWQAYTAQIAGALSALKTGEFQQMRSRLNAAAHPNRGWEWGFLSGLAEQSAGVVRAHDDMIMDLTADRAWTRLATAASDGSVRLWNTADNSLLATLQSDTGARIVAVAFTDDERAVVTGDALGVIRLLDANDLSLIRVVARMDSSVRTVAALPGGRVAVATATGQTLIQNIETGEESRIPPDQPGGVRGMVASPDGALLATFNDDGHIWVRDSSDLRVLSRLKFPGAVNQVRINRDASLLAAVGFSDSVSVWDLQSATPLHTIPVTSGARTVRSLAFSNDGAWIAAGLIHRGVVVCDARTGQVVANLGGHTDAVSGVVFSPTDDALVSSSWDRTLRTWRTEEIAWPSEGVSLAGHTDYVRALAFTPDGSTLASVSIDGALFLWDPDLALPIARLAQLDAAMYAIDISPDGALIAAACEDNLVRVWDATTGAVRAELVGDEHRPASVAFDPTGRRVAAGTADGSVRVWDVDSSEQQLHLTGHTARANSVRFSPDGALIASGSRDSTVRLWDAHTGDPLFVLDEHESDVFVVLFSPDGAHLYSGSRDQTIRVWDVRRGSLTNTLSGHGQYVTCLSFNPDATRLAAGSWFGEILLFDVATSDLIASFRAHDAAIRGVAFSPDGRWLASASYDSTVRLFDSAPRADRDAARAAARDSFAEAQETLRGVLDGSVLAISSAIDRLGSSGAAPDHNPWIRKALLSAFHPPEARP